MTRAINLVIECKKNNPIFTNWVFFKKFPKYIQKQDFLVTFSPENEDPRYTVQSSQLSGYICSEGREVKQDYMNLNGHDKTKTSNANIEDACYQVVLAAHSLIAEEFRPYMKRLDRQNNVDFKLYLLFPMIVTTANLYLCNYQVSDVSIDKGEIPIEKMKLEKVSSLWYEYPIPPHLQLTDKEWLVNSQFNRSDIYHRRYIYIVNSLEFQNALIQLISSADDLLEFS
jgi:hypothetical protein